MEKDKTITAQERREFLKGAAAFSMEAAAHYFMAVCYVLFLAGHLYLGTMGETPLALFKGMFTGFHTKSGDNP
ncbi:MAG: hypothetical protein FWH34_08055 [Desulfovibrionaceae bacterium]|nr:hypothetical protein [Desulfovibrionaceae bacterium]